MKGKKRYSNVTITKRVDHEAGRHHTVRAHPEPEVCEKCGAVYADRRWVAAEHLAESFPHPYQHPPKRTVCPACKEIKERLTAGFLYLEGSFLTHHRQEVERLIHNEEARATADNPLGRIIRWSRDERGRTIVETTTEHLAQRLGKAVQKAFSGTVRYDFSHENKLARVYWNRED